ncbi:MAG: right-handed parallel beta-helix repeat-containing protein [Victivallales bacterium]|nr:right-handed parallel beta-helix repeat-containing protein [Victivallales bacterium]
MPISRAARAVYLLSLLLSGICGAGSQYFVSPGGDDQSSGLQPKAALTGDQGPFRTLARAKQAIRDLRAKGLLMGETRVILGAGEYRLPNGIAFGPEDLGTPQNPITYAAAPEADVVVRGDVPLTNWQRGAAGVFTAKWPEAGNAAIYCDDEALPLARYPNRDAIHPRSGGCFHVAKTAATAETLRLHLNGAEGMAAASWGKLSQAVLHIWPDGGRRRRVRITAASRADRTIHLLPQTGIEPGTRGFVTGLRSELDAPGEWVADGGLLHLLPPPDCRPARDVTVAGTEILLSIQGGAGKQGALGFVGIEFRGSAGDLVRIRQAVACTFEGCRFTLCAGTAIRASQGHGLRIDGCDFRHVGGSAIQLARTHSAAIRNCWIAETGEQQGTDAAIVLADEACQDIQVSRNLIHDIPGSGIILQGDENRCERNRLHHLGLERGEGAGIVVLGGGEASPSLVRGNVIADPGGFRRLSATRYAFPAGMSGIAVLDGTGTVVSENALLRCPRAAIQLAGDKHVVENNLLVGGGRSHLEIGLAAGLGIRRNVVLSQSRQTAWIRGDQLDRKLAAVDANLLWGGDEDPHVVGDGAELSWDDWQELGNDQRSVFADPMFRASQLDDYELLPQSLALRLGFVPLQPDKAGCHASPARRTWPIRDRAWREQHLLTIRPPSGANRMQTP